MVPAPEELFREHAVLRRLLIVFEECARVTRVGGRYDARIAHDAAKMFAHFGAGYHAKSEEKFIFPLFARTQFAVVADNLRRQHVEATGYVKRIIELAAAGNQAALAPVMQDFCLMYRRHTAHEDVVLFSNLRGMLGQHGHHGLRSLGERMEEFEVEVVGPDGFEAALEELHSYEEPLGLTSEQLYG